ncbi:MAG: hypothetical protein Q9192_008800, partial [Flavoplaca navasiana]
TSATMFSDNTDFEYYHYTPSNIAVAVFMTVFGNPTLLNCWQGAGKALESTMVHDPPAVSGPLKTNGYIGLAISALEALDYTLTPYIIQSILILVAPALMSASVYMILGCIIVAVKGEAQSPITRNS